MKSTHSPTGSSEWSRYQADRAIADAQAHLAGRDGGSLRRQALVVAACAVITVGSFAGLLVLLLR
ncbi:hypothetical protein J2W68_001423 [Luteimonas terrae]|uniref:Uncharacterized protein n=1 Tax=Luteimonas terrae TaxID=1530191 RepID=A0ABU1XVC9_9GAMM|nr:hypothetical protein [Luteimonas terrae]